MYDGKSTYQEDVTKINLTEASKIYEAYLDRIEEKDKY
jgi:hypothetical protein